MAQFLSRSDWTLAARGAARVGDGINIIIDQGQPGAMLV